MRCIYGLSLAQKIFGIGQVYGSQAGYERWSTQKYEKIVLEFTSQYSTCYYRTKNRVNEVR